MIARPAAVRRCALVLPAALLLATGCGRGGGDIDHPHTLEAMVHEAREAQGAHPAPVFGIGDPTGAVPAVVAASAPG